MTSRTNATCTVLCLTLAALSSFEPASASSREFNVKSYGAKGNGRTDDTKAIQAAIKAAAPGDVVYFPSGRYLYTQTLNVAGLILKGNNHGTSNSSSLLLSGATNAYINLTGSSTTVTDVVFNAVNAPQAILANNVNGVTVNHCYFFPTALSAVSLNNVTSAAITSNDGAGIFTATNSTGLNFESNTVFGSIETTGCTTVAISKNSIKGKTYSISDTQDNQVVIQQNTLYSQNTGINSTNSTSETISDNTFDITNKLEGGVTGISAQASSKMTITGNTFEHLNFGISLQNMLTTLEISNNKISQVYYNLITVTGAVMANISNNMISNCQGGNSGVPAAAILVTNISSTATITKNEYSGKANALQYFIYTTQGAPTINASGNKTTTTLPSHIGN